MKTQFNLTAEAGVLAGVRNKPASECCVNVRDFGAIGQMLSTKGSIHANSKILKVKSLDGWVEGAGVGIAGANMDPWSDPANPAAFVTRVLSIDVPNKELHLKDAAQITVTNASINSDDSLPIQDAVNYLGLPGGTVCIPPGTYRIGTPQATTNKPIVLRSNIRVVGAGRGATILQLCQEANMLWRHPYPYDFRAAGPIFVNGSNFSWLNLNVAPANLAPYYDLPYDENIEISGITFDGDKNHQTHFYTPQYSPNPTQMPRPTNSVDAAGEADLVSGQLKPGTYRVFIRFQDAAGNEGSGMSAESEVKLTPPNNAITVTLPPVFPQGAVAVVPYICSTNETDPNGQDNFRYERLAPIPINTITPWDGNPAEEHWPTVHIYSHALFPQAPAGPFYLPRVPTQGNYPYPGIVDYYGNTGASYFGWFINVKNLYVHDVEIRNFVSDGFSLQNVNFSTFERIHCHDNGRHGLSIVTSQMEEVDLNECVFESNESLAVDMETIGCKSLRFNRCSFVNNNAGVQVTVLSEEVCQDLEFHSCLFDENWMHLFRAGGDGLFGKIINLKVKDCRFRNNTSSCIRFDALEQIVTGEITGCEFDQSNGRPRTVGPTYDLFGQSVSAIVLSGPANVFRITNNHFKPFASNAYQSSGGMIQLSDTGLGHTIQNNHFESNPLDQRQAVPPVYTPGDYKNQVLVYLADGTLGLNKISGNTGDGLIWIGDKIACGLGLEEKGGQVVATGSQSFPVQFVHALPVPPNGNYQVSAAFNWNAGAWWVSNTKASGLTINWQQPAPAQSATLTPQVVWTAKLVA